MKKLLRYAWPDNQVKSKINWEQNSHYADNPTILYTARIHIEKNNIFLTKYRKNCRQSHDWRQIGGFLVRLLPVGELRPVATAESKWDRFFLFSGRCVSLPITEHHKINSLQIRWQNDLLLTHCTALLKHSCVFDIMNKFLGPPSMPVFFWCSRIRPNCIKFTTGASLASSWSTHKLWPKGTCG